MLLPVVPISNVLAESRWSGAELWHNLDALGRRADCLVAWLPREKKSSAAQRQWLWRLVKDQRLVVWDPIYNSAICGLILSRGRESLVYDVELARVLHAESVDAGEASTRKREPYDVSREFDAYLKLDVGDKGPWWYSPSA